MADLNQINQAPTPDQMPTYLDALQQSRTNLSQITPGVGLASGATERARSILQAKSGKSAPAGGVVGQTNIDEQVAAQQAGEQLQTQVQPEMQAQQISENTGVASQAAQAGNQAAQIQQARDFSSVQYKLQVADTLQQLRQGLGQLGTEKQQALLQQASFLLSLQNKQYVEKLKQVGQMHNLSNKMNNLNEMQDLVFGSNVDLFKQTLNTQNLLTSSKMDFQNQLAQMSMEDASKIAQMEAAYRQQIADLQAQQLKYGGELQSSLASIAATGAGISGIISGAGQGVQAYENQQDRAQAAADRQNLAEALARSQSQPRTK